MAIYKRKAAETVSKSNRKLKAISQKSTANF